MFVTIKESPLLPGVSPVTLYYRDSGSGFVPLVFLHGGWGYDIYLFDEQIVEFGSRLKIIIPDRSGYGKSPRIDEQPANFHRCAAEETLALLDALEVDRAILWGHSDGAVIAAIMGLVAPDRFIGLIMEAFHYDRAKKSSRQFFETMATDPGKLGERVAAELASHHGADYWEHLIRINGRAWLRIARESDQPENDFYLGKLYELRVPALFIHGRSDPRTEPGEMESVQAQLPNSKVRFIEGAGHSPHSERLYAAESNRIAREFLASLTSNASRG
ncbi:MAG TPA: alpha/beta hydrolase [Blastocatellia bacterium]|nr:alpha/beta hydrolase [Blastocatellia bacterium]